MAAMLSAHRRYSDLTPPRTGNRAYDGLTNEAATTKHLRSAMVAQFLRPTLSRLLLQCSISPQSAA
jgi:hypothetical protein